MVIALVAVVACLGNLLIIRGGSLGSDTALDGSWLALADWRSVWSLFESCRLLSLVNRLRSELLLVLRRGELLSALWWLLVVLTHRLSWLNVDILWLLGWNDISNRCNWLLCLHINC